MRTTLLAIVPFLLITSVARADDTAESLYQQGRDAAQAQNWEVACKKFKESHDREPAPGTLLNLGDCEEHLSKLVAATERFEAASRLFRPGDARIDYARQRAAAIDKRVPRLTLRLAPTAPTGSTVERDGVRVDAALLGNPVRIDPGDHALVVHAPGRQDATSKVRLAEGESREIELAVGPPGTSPAPPTVPSDAPASAPARAAAPPPAEAPEAATRPSRAPAYAALGIGAAGIAVGTVTGLMALSAASSVKSECPDKQCSPQTLQAGQDDGQRAKTMSLVSTIGFGVGIAGAAIGTYLLLKPSPSTSVTPTVGQGAAGVILRGHFD
jgi:hypothetical protein